MLTSPLRRQSPSRKVVVVGAGIGGLVSALLLANAGAEVLVLEKEARSGGKLRALGRSGREIDSGPTVFTMRWVFEQIFAAAGARLEDHLVLRKAEILARHSWEDGSTLDLHADPERSADAIADFAGGDEAARFTAFCKRTGEVFDALNNSFMENPSPSPLGLARSAGFSGLPALARIKPFTSLWSVLGKYFHDPRLRQLFGRYATYCGSSPYDAPGPLMLIAAVEQMGVWLVEGGMLRIADALETVACERGATFRYHAPVAEIMSRGGAVSGVRLADGEVIEADAVIFNGDPAALFSGYLGEAAGGAVGAWPASARSLSALTWSFEGKASGFPLSRHSVFFSDDYAREFVDIFDKGRLPSDPTIYVCAQDRDAGENASAQGAERLFILVNAPANGDRKPLDPTEIKACETRVMERLARAGLEIDATQMSQGMTSPAAFEKLFPGTGGALYGRASHGWASSFQRPGARTRLKGLYLAGGAVHPGPGIPMAALSGSHAATALISDWGSTARYRMGATAGGTSTR